MMEKIEAGPARFSLPLPKNANYYVRGDKIPLLEFFIPTPKRRSALSY